MIYAPRPARCSAAPLPATPARGPALRSLVTVRDTPPSLSPPSSSSCSMFNPNVDRASRTRACNDGAGEADRADAPGQERAPMAAAPLQWAVLLNGARGQQAAIVQNDDEACEEALPAARGRPGSMTPFGVLPARATGLSQPVLQGVRKRSIGARRTEAFWRLFIYGVGHICRRVSVGCSWG